MIEYTTDPRGPQPGSAIDRVLARLDGVRHTPRGRIARCPGHEDQSPSLSIASGADRRVLLRCWTGCDTARIVAAVGLTMADLFERQESLRRMMPRPVTEREIREALAREAAAYRATRGIRSTERLLTGELNGIRRRVAMRYGVRLAPLPRSPHEGNYGGREREDLWRVAFARAHAEVWWEQTGGPPPCELDERDMSPLERIATEDRAAELYRDMIR